MGFGSSFGSESVIAQIICQYDVPHTIIIDDERRFDNNNFREFRKKLNIKNYYSSSSVHLQVNGQVKTVNQVFK